MRVISKAGEYGLRALLYMVSENGEQEYVNIRDMSEKLDISFHFLTKILQNLTQKGLLRSYRGPNGGVAFLIPPESIYLTDLIKALEGDDFFDKCLLGLPGCGEAQPCPMHNFWKEIKDKLKSEFAHTTLADLGQAIRKQRFRLIP
ncbi:MAG: Rrf2 family transcriptional regulator [Thermoanaerobaculia bacterium]|nr:Rrf2 family transcriptional regulator [Thermoanaerobaculia bacterium]